ncbi:nucleotidyltransferase family protein [Candidatus Bathyarchaeota archaeon]|nr:MAG: nucleotidyltransferase family protein [Candidatus Bathyarchaeota archaeon]
MDEVCAAVLCGGVGSRLRPLTYYFQKAMIPIGSKQKPLLEYIILLLRKYGVRDIVLLAGYKYRQILNYFGDGERFGVRINYVLDRENLKGTGWALLNAYENGVFDKFKHILVYYGDILSSIDIGELLRRHKMLDSSVTVAVSRGYRLPVGIAHLDGLRIVKFEEKPIVDIPVCIGILVLKKNVLETMSNLSKRYVNMEFDLMSHLIPALIARGEDVYAYETKAFWYDVGSTEKYEKLDNSFADRLLETLEKT